VPPKCYRLLSHDDASPRERLCAQPGPTLMEKVEDRYRKLVQHRNGGLELCRTSSMSDLRKPTCAQHFQQRKLNYAETKPLEKPHLQHLPIFQSGGEPQASRDANFSSDKSWMIRSILSRPPHILLRSHPGLLPISPDCGVMQKDIFGI
jgi:hypothetical protein